jgi:2-polyprenyl-6-methoxyphenol hydroxylase-like FAD-dependent oxidoreductase
MRILIVGGGIAGLTLAGLLRQRGETPLVIEKAPAYGDVGYVLSLWPLGNRVLHGLHLFDAFAAASMPLNHYTVHDARGQRLRSLPMRATVGEFRTLMRADLLDVLRAVGGGIPVRMSCTVTALSQRDGAVQVRLSDGTEAIFDLVVGADGIHSQVQQLLFGEHALKQTGLRLWSWWQHAPELPRDEVHEFWGAHCFLGIYPVRDRIAVVAVMPSDSALPASLADRRMLVRQHFANYGGKLVRQLLSDLDMVDAIDPTDLADSDLSHWYAGRVLLIGDAGAAFLPTAGIGASVAMESAAVLNDELSRVDAATIPTALQLFVRRRRARVDALQGESRWLVRVMFPRLPFVAWARDVAVRRLSEKQLLGTFTHWLERPT